MMSLTEMDKIMMHTKKQQIISSIKKKKLSPLRTFAKFLNLKISGRKNEVTCRIIQFLQLSHYALKIQRLCCRHLLKKRLACKTIQQFVRNKLIRKIFLLRGPAVLKRKLCNNSIDFLTGDSMQEISIFQFFSFQDEDGFLYGFDILSIYNMLRNGTPKNPYNRNLLSNQTIESLQSLVKLSKTMKLPCQIHIVREKATRIATTKDRILNVFKVMDSLGNYTSPSWLLNLTFSEIIKFLRELTDIWHYRCQIPYDIKRRICPPNGNPFQGSGYLYYQEHDSLERLQTTCVKILESILLYSVDDEAKTLGAYLILSALTLVSQEAAISLPWLYESVL